MNNLESLFNEKIEALTELVLQYPFENREAYGRFLNQQYYLVENSTRYLALAASRVSTKARAEFREWAHHLTEEFDHDQMILNDMKRLGYAGNDPMGPFTRAIIATQYYQIEKSGPNALLGYALMLEGLSVQVCAVLAKRVDDAFGPGKSTYLKLHASVDLEHYPEGIAKVKTFDETQSQIVRENLETMAALYTTHLNSLMAANAKSTRQVSGLTASQAATPAPMANAEI